MWLKEKSCDIAQLTEARTTFHLRFVECHLLHAEAIPYDSYDRFVSSDMVRLKQARHFYERSLEALNARDGDMDGDKTRREGQVIGNGSILTYRFLIATAGVPIFYDSNDHITQVSCNHPTLTR